jgi:hypothetical protein
MLMSKLFKKDVAVHASDAVEQGFTNSRNSYHTW